MTDTLVVRGSFDFATGGTFTHESLPYVLTASLEQIALGTRAPEPPFDGYLRWGDGTANVYDLNPVHVGGWGSFELFSAGSAWIVTTPHAAFEDFAIYEAVDADPVNGFVVSNNNVASGGAQQAWARYSKVFVPPKKASFVVGAARFASLAANTHQYIDTIQIEEGGAATAFTPAREVQVNVRPNRLNYSTNPTLNAAAPQAYTVPSLLVGKQYIHSVKFTGTNPAIAITAGATLISSGVSGDRVWVTFTTTATSVSFNVTGTGTVSQPLTERGTVLGTYFDGGSGPDYLWEQGGTPGSTRSYYYEDRGDRHYILVRSLQENVPLGTPVASPEYASGPPTS